jgi:hypothetical protein
MVARSIHPSMGGCEDSISHFYVYPAAAARIVTRGITFFSSLRGNRNIPSDQIGVQFLSIHAKIPFAVFSSPTSLRGAQRMVSLTNSRAFSSSSCSVRLPRYEILCLVWVMLSINLGSQACMKAPGHPSELGDRAGITLSC